ncbi:hypothetical protein Tco_1342016, partial [Tanacetum coccineum]
DDELDAILASIDFSDLPPLDITDIPPFVCNMGKRTRNKKQPSKNYKMSYNGVTIILVNFLLFNIPVDRDVPIIMGRSFLYTYGAIVNTIKGITSTFDGIVHQNFYVANVRNAYIESNSDDEVEYCLKIDEMGMPIYGPNHAKYLSCDDPMDRALALQESLNPFKKICVWKKAC